MPSVNTRNLITFKDQILIDFSLHYNYKKSKSTFPSLHSSESNITLHSESSELSPLSSSLHHSSLYNSSRSLIFALTGLANEEDKNITY